MTPPSSTAHGGQSWPCNKGAFLLKCPGSLRERGVAQLVLAIDIGNSTTNIGFFDPAGKLVFRSGLTTSVHATRDQCAISLMGVFQLHGADIRAVTGSILSSVVPSVTANMCAAVEFLTGTPTMLMGPGVKTGLNIKSDIHTQMGSDIVACSVAAIAQYPTPVIVIDMGTATTISYLQGNTYEGCVILPGVRVALEALSERAAALPHISIETPAAIFGHNTVDAMRAGAVYGNASMLDGMIVRLEEAGGSAAAVVATGGGAPEILKYCRRSIQYDADLLLRGLYLIYQKNTEGRQRRA